MPGPEPGPATSDEFDELRQLIVGSADLLARHAPDGTYRYASPAARQLLGYAPDELIGRSAYDFVHPDDVGLVEETHRAVLAAPELRTIVYRVRHRGGYDVWFETAAHTVIDPVTGEVVEIQTSSRDVTARVAARTALRASERRFRLAMAHAPIGMALVGLDGRFVEVNDSLCDLLGRPNEELVELTFQDITHPEDLDTDLGYAAELLAGTIQHYTMEKRYLHPSGHDVWALLSGSLVRDDDGEPLYYIAQIVDIGARKRALLELARAKDELERSNAELERFAAVAAHDLRSPLATVRGLLELVGDRYADLLDQQGQRIVAVAGRVTTQMAETVEGLLTLAAAETDRLHVTVLDVGDLFDQVLEAIASALAEADADVRIGPLPAVRGDAAQLRVLFQNLLVNAVKFREPRRRLTVAITAVRDGPAWRFEVADNGRGFAGVDREVIFEPFARDHEGYAVGSIGLGLATCRRIVERHGGLITAHPADPGARFEFTLPDAAVDVLPEPPRAAWSERAVAPQPPDAPDELEVREEGEPGGSLAPPDPVGTGPA
jgi:PAS domain S-box-containing protein